MTHGDQFRVRWMRRVVPGVVESATLCALFFAMHALVLRFVFPGYYDPLWPHHSDYYIGAALAHSADGFRSIFGYPRPVGFAIYWALGHLATRGVIFATLFIVASNFALIVVILRRMCDIRLSLAAGCAAAIFAYLLVSHPYQYEISTWDAFAQFSVFFLLIATLSFLRGAPWWVGFLFAVLAFLNKETFAISAMFLAGVWFLLRFRTTFWKAITPLLVVGAAFVLTFLISRITGSIFVAGANYPGSPYEIVLRPQSVFAEWARYAAAGVNGLGWAVILLTAVTACVMTGPRSPIALSSIALPIAGALAWLPNSVLPNHYVAAYSWSAAYLLYSPVILLAAIVTRGILAKLFALVVAAAALSTPVLFGTAYAREDWILQNQSRQKRLMETLGNLIQQLPDRDSAILVSGFNFPFSPFDHWRAILSMHPPAGAKFYVVTYRTGPEGISPTRKLDASDGTVTRIAPDVVGKMHFDQAWLFNSNGELIQNTIDPSTVKRWTGEGFDGNDLLAYPELSNDFGPRAVDRELNKAPGYRYLACGNAFLSYENPKRAEACLQISTRMISDNPYPYFFLGTALEQQGKMADARAAYERAVALEGNSPNPAFRNALAKLQ